MVSVGDIIGELADVQGICQSKVAHASKLGMCKTLALKVQKLDKVTSSNVLQLVTSMEACVMDDAYKSIIQTAIDARVAGNVAKKGNGTQELVNILCFLSELDWQKLGQPNLSAEERRAIIVNRYIKLGIRNPSEQTGKWVISLVLHFYKRDTGAWPLHSTIYQWLLAFKREIGQSKLPYLHDAPEIYPNSPADLPMDMLVDGYEVDDGPVTKAVPAFDKYGDHIPLRSNSLLLIREQQRLHGAAKGGMPYGGFNQHQFMSMRGGVKQEPYDPYGHIAAGQRQPANACPAFAQFPAGGQFAWPGDTASAHLDGGAGAPALASAAHGGAGDTASAPGSAPACQRMDAIQIQALRFRPAPARTAAATATPKLEASMKAEPEASAKAEPEASAKAEASMKAEPEAGASRLSSEAFEDATMTALRGKQSKRSIKKRPASAAVKKEEPTSGSDDESDDEGIADKPAMKAAKSTVSCAAMKRPSAAPVLKRPAGAAVGASMPVNADTIHQVIMTKAHYERFASRASAGSSHYHATMSKGKRSGLSADVVKVAACANYTKACQKYDVFAAKK